MNTQHTPGPWLIQGKTVYALMHHSWCKGVEQFKNRFYASVYVDRECSEEEAEANARLIAAAPELLAALNAMLTHMGMDEDEFTKPTFDQARAAIAKATGEAK